MVSATQRESKAFYALCHTNLSAFAQWVFKKVDPGAKYQHNWHVDLIAHCLEMIHRREIKDLIINIPPGYMKSILVNVAFTAWVLGHNPSERIISASNSNDLASENERKVKEIMQHPDYKKIFPKTRIASARDGKIVTTKQGIRYATSFESRITGKDSNLNIIDDPHDADDAFNVRLLRKANITYDRKIQTRLRDKKDGATVIIMQRLHQEDLTGHVMQKQPDRWTQIKLTGQAASDETWRYKVHCLGSAEPLEKVKIREKGEYLHPSREGRKEHEAMKITLGPAGYSAQYDQDPTPDGGGMIKKKDVNRYTVQRDPEEFEQIVQSWDTAQKADQLNDYSVCSTWGVTREGNMHLLHVWRDKLEFPELVAQFCTMTLAWRPHASLVEDKSSGSSLIQSIKKMGGLDIPGGGKFYPNVERINPERDKVTRMATETPAVRAGRLWIPQSETQPWLVDWEMEIFKYPKVSNDDQVDALSQFLCYCRTRPGTNVTVPARQPSVADNLGSHNLDLGGFGLW